MIFSNEPKSRTRAFNQLITVLRSIPTNSQIFSMSSVISWLKNVQPKDQRRLTCMKPCFSFLAALESIFSTSIPNTTIGTTPSNSSAKYLITGIIPFLEFSNSSIIKNASSFDFNFSTTAFKILCFVPKVGTSNSSAIEITNSFVLAISSHFTKVTIAGYFFLKAVAAYVFPRPVLPSIPRRSLFLRAFSNVKIACLKLNVLKCCQ